MKYKNILLSFGMIFALVLALSVVSAAVDVTYNAYYATIEDDGTIDYSSNSISGFDTVGYICTSADCATVDEQQGSLSGQTRSTSSDSITLTFPTVLQNSNGYGTWFYKQDYIGYERLSNWEGTGTAPEEYNIYFLRKETGYAPIMGLNVINEVNPLIPVEVSVNVEIDADTYSALENAGPLDYEPAELDSMNVVETEVRLEIRDSQNQVIYSNSTNVDVPYSGSVPVSFTYNGFSDIGNYEVRIETDVTDAKIINSDTQRATAGITVIPFGDTEFAYTILNNLEMSPALPDEGDTVDFSVDYRSNYVEADQSLTSIDTRIEVSIFRSGTEISDDVYYEDNSGTLSFDYTFNEPGSYRIVIKGEPEDADDYDDVVGDIEELTFVIGEDASLDDDDDDDDDNYDDDDDDDEDAYWASINPADDGTYVINLTEPAEESKFTLKTFLWVLFWAILLLVAIISMVLYSEFWLGILIGFLVFVLIIIGIVKFSWLLWAFLIALTIVIASVLFKVYAQIK